MIEFFIVFVVGILVGRLTTEWGRNPTFRDIDIMMKYNVEFPELKRMKKRGLV